MAPRPHLRVLVAATKFPWPPIDGGRLVLATTLEALATAGVGITLVSPPAEGDGSAPASIRHHAIRPRSGSWAGTLLQLTTPATIVRHTHPDAIAAIESLVAGDDFDLVHAEQLQTVAELAPARRRGLPMVLRAQNVESDLWAGAARALPLASPWLRYQAALLRRFEGRAVAGAELTVALTALDAARLRGLAGYRGDVVNVPAPFPPTLPANDEPLAGTPALVVAAGGWIPNRDGARWFLRRVWPRVRARLPGARLHLFGYDTGAPVPDDVSLHPAPRDSIELFAAGSLHVVPLRVASGVRMKILEAWARGVPTVATGEAAAGLEQGAGEALLTASSAEDLAAAIAAVARDSALAHRLVDRGRVLLAGHHDPARIAARWRELYLDAIDRHRRGASPAPPSPSSSP